MLPVPPVFKIPTFGCDRLLIERTTDKLLVAPVYGIIGVGGVRGCCWSSLKSAAERNWPVDS